MVLLTASGAPLALLIGVMFPSVWVVTLAWPILVIAAAMLDFVQALSRRDIEVQPDLPSTLYIGASDDVVFLLGFKNNAAAPASLEARLETSELLKSEQISSDLGAGFRLTPLRRGNATVDALWLRWKGPFGLIWRQVRLVQGIEIAITPDVRSVSQEAMRMFSRDALFGQKAQLDRGAGSEFDALREFTTGMDKRTIDWKQSARHRQLIAKEYRNERNHPIHFVFDTGRLMSQPLDGVPRIDRAVNAALLMAYVSLKLGDRVGLFGFDEQPRLATGAISGANAFPLLQRQASKLEYTAMETNFTLGLTRLGAHLDRRSLIVIFTDFADTTSAELMLEHLNRLLKQHLVLFVAFQDEELESLLDAEPIEAEDITRAVVAAELLKERDIVLNRLSRMGAQILDTRANALNIELVNRYLGLKQQDKL